MYQNMVKDERIKKAKAEGIEAKRAEVKRRLNALWAEKGLLGERTKYGFAGRGAPLPGGVSKEDLQARKVGYLCTELRDSAVVHLFINMDPDSKNWGEMVQVRSANRDILKTLDRKISRVNEKSEI